MTYIPLCFPIPNTTQAHTPIHSPNKWLESNSDVQYTSIIFITHVPNHHYPNNPNKIFVISYSNLIHIFTNIYITTKTRLLRHLFYAVHIKTIQTPRFTDFKKAYVLCSLISTTHTPTVQHAQIPPIIHHMIIISLHTSTHHTIKTRHNSQPSYDKNIFVAPCLYGENPKLPPPPKQRGGIRGGDNIILKW